MAYQRYYEVDQQDVYEASDQSGNDKDLESCNKSVSCSVFIGFGCVCTDLDSISESTHAVAFASYVRSLTFRSVAYDTAFTLRGKPSLLCFVSRCGVEKYREVSERVVMSFTLP